MTNKSTFSDDVERMINAIEQSEETNAERYIFGDVESGKLMLKRILHQMSVINDLLEENKKLKEEKKLLVSQLSVSLGKNVCNTAPLDMQIRSKKCENVI